MTSSILQRPEPAVPAETVPRARLGTHIPALDGLRAVAVLGVLMLHFKMLTPGSAVEHSLANVLAVGWTGVDLFFVLSGFLITGILYDAKGSAAYFRTFYMRRTLRIFPLYYAYLAILFLLLPVLLPHLTGDYRGFDNVFWLWTYLGNVKMALSGWEGMPGHTVHLWSLAVEEQFYLLWPLLVWATTRKGMMRLCVIATIAATLYRVALIMYWDNPVAAYSLMPARMDALAIGGFVALAARGEGGIASIHRFTKPIAMLAAAALVVVSYNASADDSLLPPLAPLVQEVGYLALALTFAGILSAAVAAREGSLVHRVLTVKPLIAIGKYSYAMYLLHIPLRDEIRDIVGGRALPMIFGSQIPVQLALLGIGVIVPYLVAVASWHLFEKHFLALKRYFEYRPRTSAEAPVTAPAERLQSAPAHVNA